MPKKTSNLLEATHSPEEFIKAAQQDNAVNLFIIKMYIASNHDINVTDKNHRTALICAAQNGALSNVTVLLQTPGININACDDNNDTALTWAARNGHKDIVQAVLDHGAKVAAGQVANLKQHDAISNLLQKFYEGTEFIRAAKEGGNENLTIVQRYIATHRNQPDALDFLDKQGGTALFWAAHNGHLDIVKILLNYGANIYLKNNNKTPEQEAAAQGHAEIVELLRRSREICEFLQSAKEQKTNIDVLNQFVDKNRNNSQVINATDKEGNTALMWFALHGLLYHVQSLLTSPKINVNAANRLGDTALIQAARNGNIFVASALLDHGANMNHQNQSCSSAEQEALRLHHVNVEHLLRRLREANEPTQNSQYSGPV